MLTIEPRAYESGDFKVGRPSRWIWIMQGREPGMWWHVWWLSAKKKFKVGLGVVGGSPELAARLARERWPFAAGMMELEEVPPNAVFRQKYWCCLADHEQWRCLRYPPRDGRD